MTSRGIRRKKSSLAEVKVLVVGAPSVGKSAITVRFLTKRYIGEYDHHHDGRYHQEFMLEGEALFVEILDTCPKSLEELPGEDVMDWADGVVLVYSVTDRESFNYVRRVKNLLKPQTPMTLVGNKIDVIHLRQVSTEEGDICAKDFECSFFEVSAAEQVVEIIKMFRELCHEIMATRRRAKYSLFDRMLGNKPCRVYARGKSDSALPKQ